MDAEESVAGRRAYPSGGNGKNKRYRTWRVQCSVLLQSSTGRCPVALVLSPQSRWLLSRSTSPVSNPRSYRPAVAVVVSSFFCELASVTVHWALCNQKQVTDHTSCRDFNSEFCAWTTIRVSFRNWQKFTWKCTSKTITATGNRFKFDIYSAMWCEYNSSCYVQMFLSSTKRIHRIPKSPLANVLVCSFCLDLHQLQVWGSLQ